jgi:hypothetical protein
MEGIAPAPHPSRVSFVQKQKRTGFRPMRAIAASWLGVSIEGKSWPHGFHGDTYLMGRFSPGSVAWAKVASAKD